MRPVRRAFAALTVVAALLPASAVLATSAASAPTGPTPQPVETLVDRPLQGKAALAAVSGRVGDVARANGTSEAQLRRVLSTDATAWLDSDARLFHVDPEATEAEKAASNAASRKPSAPTTTTAAADTFALHSKPGSNRVVYLDFDGFVLTGTAWNQGKQDPITIPPYDTDGSPSTFGTAERAVIEEVWKRVAEDYRPFDIDVTTQDPGAAALNRSSSTDTTYGSRVVIDPSSWYYSSCGCGGVAYVGTVDSANNGYNQPAWVFTQGVGTGAKNIAEAASHEVGHNFGLSHDGTSSVGYYRGHGAWAPIMGVGYSEPITQWSKGEYADANNRQDDFVVIGQNGGALRAADGTSMATASPLTVGTPVTGVVTGAPDVDWFKVTVAAGSRTFTAAPAAVGANLDIRLSVRNSAGTQVGTWNPASAQVSTGTASGLGASGTLNLAAGTYYVVVDGTGAADPLTTGYSDYGSAGEFTLTVS